MYKYHTEYSSITKSLQALKETITQIIITGEFTDDDILSIRYWMDDNMHLAGNYPFDKIYSIIDGILSDGVIDSEERQSLLEILQSETIYNATPFIVNSLAGYHVCLTGNFTFAKRKELEYKLMQYCAFNEKSVNSKTDFLFVGGLGNQDWAYGNYGNKIKRAKELQEAGHPILIFGEDILENFFKTHTLPITYSFEQCLDVLSSLPDEAQKYVLYEINHVINGGSGIVFQKSVLTNLLIEKNILHNCEGDYPYERFLYYLSRNELIVRIESLNLELTFKKNISLDDLIKWCQENIPEHIPELCHDFMLLKLNEPFLNPEVLVRISHYFSAKFPHEL